MAIWKYFSVESVIFPCCSGTSGSGTQQSAYRGTKLFYTPLISRSVMKYYRLSYLILQVSDAEHITALSVHLYFEPWNRSIPSYFGTVPFVSAECFSWHWPFLSWGSWIEAVYSLPFGKSSHRGSASLQERVRLLQLVLSSAEKVWRSASHFRFPLTDLHSAEVQFQYANIEHCADLASGESSGPSRPSERS